MFRPSFLLLSCSIISTRLVVVFGVVGGGVVEGAVVLVAVVVDGLMGVLFLVVGVGVARSSRWVVFYMVLLMMVVFMVVLVRVMNSCWVWVILVFLG